MKLLLFILTLTLCTAAPSFKRIQASHFGQDLALPTLISQSSSGDDTDNLALDFDGIPRWLFQTAFSSEEESLEENILNEEEGFTQGFLVEIREDDVASDLFDFGFNTVIARGVNTSMIPDLTFRPSTVSAYSREPSDKGELYRFTVRAVSQDRNTVLNMVYAVYYEAATRNRTLSSYSFTTNSKFSIDESAFIEMNKAEAENNAEVKSALDYAIREAVKDWQQYTTVNTKSVYVQTLRGIVYYKFDVDLDNNKGKTVNLGAIVAYQPETRLLDVKTYQTKTTTVTPKN